MAKVDPASKAYQSGQRAGAWLGKWLLGCLAVALGLGVLAGGIALVRLALGL